MAAYLGIPKDEVDEKLEEIIEFSELGHFIDEPMRHYSSGMKARLGFSVATALQPDILLLDEVFSVGDARFRHKSKRRIDEMMARCRLIAVVSHSTDFLRSLCTDVLWLEQGRVVRLGKAGDVLDEYEEVMGPGDGLDMEPDPA
jgi:ABC-type polysaccharide/polyol phosphate transport system ATPase subunit